MTGDSYDDKQAHAPLVTCPSCGSEVYATDGDRPDWLCRVCRARPAAESRVLPFRQHCGVAMNYLELPDYYDGALFLVCESCSGWAHRFAADHYLRAKADRAVGDGCLDPLLEIDAR